MNAPSDRSGSGLARLAAAALLLPLLSACFTTTLWGGSLEDTDGDGAAEISLGSGSGGGPNEGPNLAMKLLLTPFTVIFDICTSPIQAFLYGWDQDSDD